VENHKQKLGRVPPIAHCRRRVLLQR